MYSKKEGSQSCHYQAKSGSEHRDRLLQAQSASRLPVQSFSTAGTVHCTAQRRKQDRLLQAQSVSRLPVQSFSTEGTVHCTGQRQKQDRLLQAQSVSRLPMQSDSTAGTVRTLYSTEKAANHANIMLDQAQSTEIDSCRPNLPAEPVCQCRHSVQQVLYSVQHRNRSKQILPVSSLTWFRAQR